MLPADEPLLEARGRRTCPSAQAPLRPGRGPAAAAAGGDVRILEFVPAGERGSVMRLAVGDEPVVVRLPLAGEHNARNAAAALAVVLALGVPAARRRRRPWSGWRCPPHRSRLVPPGGRHVLDDCYNANPASMAAALATVLAAAAGGGAAPSRCWATCWSSGEEADAAPPRAGARRWWQLRLCRPGGAGRRWRRRWPRARRQAGLPADRVLVTQEPPAAAEAIAGWSREGDWVW